MRSRIAFAEDCEQFGANHFEPYQSAFTELAKNSKNDDTTACCATWSEKTEDDVGIEHYSKGQLLHKDVTKGNLFLTQNFRTLGVSVSMSQ